MHLFLNISAFCNVRKVLGRKTREGEQTKEGRRNGVRGRDRKTYTDKQTDIQEYVHKFRKKTKKKTTTTPRTKEAGGAMINIFLCLILIRRGEEGGEISCRMRSKGRDQRESYRK